MTHVRTGLMGALAAASLAPFAAAAPAAAATPACDAIAGSTIALNARWRIVQVGGRFGARPTTLRLLACERSRRGPARVRVLVSGASDGQAWVTGLQGDRAVVRWRDSPESSGGELAQLALIDLRRGVARGLGTDGWAQSPGTTITETALGPSGAVGVASWPDTATRDPGTGGAVQLIERDGTREAGVVAHRLAPSRAGAHGGVYWRSLTTGAIGRAPFGRPPQLSGRGQDVRQSGTPTRRALRWRTPDLPAIRTDRGERRHAIAASGAQGREVQLRTRRVAAGRRQASLVIGPDPVFYADPQPDPVEREIRLAAGGERDVRVLGVSGAWVLVAARFADDPERRIRLIGRSTAAVPVDVPADPQLDGPGRTALSDRQLALADAQGLRLWFLDATPSVPIAGLSTVDAAGPTDLAALPATGYVDRDGVFYTTADGVVRFAAP